MKILFIFFALFWTLTFVCGFPKSVKTSTVQNVLEKARKTTPGFEIKHLTTTTQPFPSAKVATPSLGIEFSSSRKHTRIRPGFKRKVEMLSTEAIEYYEIDDEGIITPTTQLLETSASKKPTTQLLETSASKKPTTQLLETSASKKPTTSRPWHTIKMRKPLRKVIKTIRKPACKNTELVEYTDEYEYSAEMITSRFGRRQTIKTSGFETSTASKHTTPDFQINLPSSKKPRCNVFIEYVTVDYFDINGRKKHRRTRKKVTTTSEKNHYDNEDGDKNGKTRSGKRLLPELSTELLSRNKDNYDYNIVASVHV